MHFIWLLDSGVARNGKHLTHGKEHAVSIFGESVVAVWVEQGAAAYAKDKKKKGGEE